jgi:hypothetical protein
VQKKHANFDYEYMAVRKWFGGYFGFVWFPLNFTLHM